jgi:ATP-dependent Clp protease adapter protein ClpS
MGLVQLVLLTFFAVVPAVLFFSFRWVARRWVRTRPDHPLAAKVMSSGGAAPSSVILPLDTSLLSLAEFVPLGFQCGVEFLNDNATPMEFVVSVLSSHLGLNRREAIRIMLTIHSKGGALLPTPSRAAAAAAALAITSEAASLGYSLVCRAVHVG